MREFDLRAAGAAVDSRREALGISWSTVAAELGVSVSTLRALGARPTAEGDGVLRMLAWIGKGPNDAAFGGTEREARRMTWRQIAGQCKVESAVLTRLQQGCRTTYPNIARVLTWLGPPASRFVRTVSP